MAPLPVLPRVLLGLALLGGGLAAFAEPLDAAQQQVLRDARSSDDRPRFDAGRALARSLGKAGNADAVAFLVALRNPDLLAEFANNYAGPTTPELEQLVIAHRHDRTLATPLLRMVRGYRSRALFEALLADLRGPATAWEQLDTARAIVRTELPIEAELVPLLAVLPPQQAHEIAAFLVQRRHAPAQPVLLALLEHTPPGEGSQLTRLARTVMDPPTPAAFAAAVRALAAARTLPPTPERPPYGRLDADGLERLRLRAANEDLDALTGLLQYAPPRFTLDRAVLGPVSGFAHEHRARVAEMLAFRAVEERRFAEVTPDNFVYWANRHDRIEELKSFLARGADVNAAGRARDTPLLGAVKGTNTEAIALLLDAGADPNAADWEGQAPLHLVARQNSPDDARSVPRSLNTARLLIARGARVSAPVPDGRTPLHVAVAAKFRPMVELLAASGADVNAEAIGEGLPGLTPTQLAQDIGDAETEAWLRGQGGRTPAAYAMKRSARRAAAAVIAPLFIQH